MLENAPIETQPRRLRTMALMAVAGLAAGLPAGWFVGRMIKAAKIQTLPWSDDGALTLAATFLVCGLVVVVLSLGQRGRAMLANPSAPEFERVIGHGQVVFFRMQAGVLILAGAMLAAPVAASLLAKGGPVAHGGLLMAAVVACFALQTALNLLIWARADEVMRQVIAESGAASFWVLQGAYFVWACGVKLQVLPEMSSWDGVTVLMAAYLITSSIVAYRRGLG